MSQESFFRVTPQERQSVYESHNKTEEQIKEDIENIKNWLIKQPHLPQDEDDNRLRMMLILNKFSIEKTRRKLDLYYSVRNIVPEYYTDREPLNPDVSNFLNYRIWTVLPHLNKDLCRIFIFRLDECKSEDLDVILFSKIFFSSLDLRMIYDTCVGEHFILDYNNLTLGHIIKLNLIYTKNMYTLFQKAYSDRIKGMHFINVPSVGIPIINLFNSLLSAKLANRVIVHKSVDTMHAHISKEILPFEYGGDFGSIADIHDKWRLFLESKNSWLMEDALRRSDESKRTTDPLDSELFGMAGTFRQLNVD